YTAERREGELLLVLLDEEVSHNGRMLKIPTAFFRISFSSFRRRNSRSSWAVSLSRGLPFPGKAVCGSVSSCFFQVCRELALTPRSRATALILPRSLARRTASRLNSAVNDLRSVIRSPRSLDGNSIPRGDVP